MRKIYIILIIIIALIGVVNATTVDIYPNNDARVSRVVTSETFSTITGGAGTAIDTGANASISCIASTTSNQFANCRRILLTFNTTLPAGSVISSATLRTYGTYAAAGWDGLGTNLWLSVTNASPASQTSFVKEDYNKFGSNSLIYSNYIQLSSWARDGNNNFTLNSAGISSINSTGFTTFGLQHTWQTSGTFNGTWSSGKYSLFGVALVEYTGVTYDPYLEITYTIPDITPPASITNLSNSTTCNSINFTWTNPTDSDYNGLMVYRNGIFLYNLSNTATFDFWRNLSSSNSFTISTKTFDTTGNVNASWVNQSASTTSCVNPVASFTSNATSCGSQTVQFNDTSSNSPTGWAWFFGDEPYNQSWVQQSSGVQWKKRLEQTMVSLPDGSLVLSGGSALGVGCVNDTWRSTDKGATWVLQSASAPWISRYYHSSVVSPVDGSIILLGGVNDDATTIRMNDTWRSIDDGVTWAEQNASSGWSARSGLRSVSLSNGHIVMMGGYTDSNSYSNETWKSTDNGVTWVKVNSSSGWSARAYEGATVMSDDSIIITGGWVTGETGVNDTWRSTDEGSTWIRQSTSGGWTQRDEMSTIAMPDNSLILIDGYDNNYNNDTWRSTDKGVTWTNITTTPGWDKRTAQRSKVLPDGSIVLAGGQDNSGTLNDTWRFNPVGSSAQNPTHLFTAGNWSVHLVSASQTGYNITSGWINITASCAGAPIASFTANKAFIRIPNSVTMTDTSTNTPTGWNWSWGDGTWTNGTTQNATHQYLKRGFWNIFLLSSNAGGSNTSASQSVRVVGYQDV